MSLWKAESVFEDPEISLTRYRVLEDQNGSRYFVGYNAANREGRVSTAIVKWDKDTRCGVTKSGRIYHLQGNPGYDDDAEYVWQHYKRINGIVYEQEVTSELFD